METLLAVLAIFAVLAIAIVVIAAPLLLIGWVLKAPPPTVLHQDPRWTDDDEIAARHHM